MSYRKPNTGAVTKKPEIIISKLEIISNQSENYRLKEMKDKLNRYKLEVEESIKLSKPIENDNFKSTFFESLEGLLKDMAYISDKKLRDEKIDAIYRWYNLKMSSFKKLNKIESRTSAYFYENQPDVSDYVKSSYYEAINYPENFEKDHRTEEIGLLPPKDRLKEFKTRRLIKENKEKELNMTKSKDDLGYLYADDKQRLMSATSSIGMRTTNYTASQTHSKFFTPSNNKVEIIDPVREIKSSYSYYRPKYEFTNLNIEKNSIQAKHRELAEKRHQEEMKEFMNEFSMNKAFYKEEVEKKFATRSLINFYQSELKKEKIDESENQSEDENANEVKVKTVFLNDHEIINEEENKNIIKVDINNIKNIGEDNKLIINKEEICVNIHVKDNNSKQETIQNLKIKHEKLPSDAIPMLKILDPLYNTRYNYSKMLDVKEIDNPKTEYKSLYSPLSAYDSMNVNLIPSTTTPAKKAKSRPYTGYEYIRDNFKNDDLLGQKTLLSNHKVADYNRLKDSLIKLNNKTVSFPSLKSAFLPPPEDVIFPKFYLPITGADLFSRPVENVPKKKGKK